MNKLRFSVDIFILIGALLFVIIIAMIISFSGKKEKSSKSISSVSSLSSSVSIIKENPFGSAIKISGKNAIIIRKNTKEEIKDKKLVYAGSTLIAEDSKLVISNKNSAISIEPGSRVYIGSNAIAPASGKTEVDGRININVLGYKIYGEGRIIIKIKENQIQISQYRGKTKIKKDNSMVELGEGEGIILYKESFEAPFKLPEAPQDIKVKIY